VRDGPPGAGSSRSAAVHGGRRLRRPLLSRRRRCFALHALEHRRRPLTARPSGTGLRGRAPVARPPSMAAVASGDRSFRGGGGVSRYTRSNTAAAPSRPVRPGRASGGGLQSLGRRPWRPSPPATAPFAAAAVFRATRARTPPPPPHGPSVRDGPPGAGSSRSAAVHGGRRLRRPLL